MIENGWDVNWGKWYTCSQCKNPETLLAHNECNRKHWTWGIFKTTSMAEHVAHMGSVEHLQHFNQFKCVPCNVQCYNSYEFEAHCKTSKHEKISKVVIRCEMCDYETHSRSNMNQHEMTQKHMDRLNAIEKETYFCEQCDYTARFKSQMEQHELTKKHKDNVSGIVAPHQLACETCMYTTEFKHHLDQHFKTQKHKNKVNGDIPKVNLYCEKCEYAAATPALMAQHCKSKKHIQEK